MALVRRRRVRRVGVRSGVGHLCQTISARFRVTHSWSIFGARGGASDLRSAGGKTPRLGGGGQWRISERRTLTAAT